MTHLARADLTQPWTLVRETGERWRDPLLPGDIVRHRLYEGDSDRHERLGVGIIVWLAEYEAGVLWSR